MSDSPDTLADVFPRLYRLLDDYVSTAQFDALKQGHALLSEASKVHQQYMQISRARGGAPGEPLNIQFIEDLLAHSQEIEDIHSKLSEALEMFERIHLAVSAAEGVLACMEPALARAREIVSEEG